MARSGHGRRPPRRSFNRRHRHPERVAGLYRLGKRTRTQFQRLVNTIGPSGPALMLLTVLLDLARDPLDDVKVTQDQLAEAWEKRLPWAANGWGSGVATVRRATRELVEGGWISLCDVPVAGGGGRHMIVYRIHIPDHPAVAAAWLLILHHTNKKQEEAVSGPRSRAAVGHGGRPAIPPATGADGEAVAELAPADELPGGAAAALAAMRRNLRGPPGPGPGATTVPL